MSAAAEACGKAHSGGTAKSGHATSAALAGSLAGELREKPELAEWVLSIAGQPRSVRSDSLLQTATMLRRDSHGFEAADALKRMASRPAIFRAVLRELRGSIGAPCF